MNELASESSHEGRRAQGDEQLRVGIIGAGPWARSVHAPGIADHPGTRLTSVWARRRDAATEVAGPYGAGIADSPEALLDTVDAVAFAVPPAVQVELAIAAVRAGKHVILEKPIAADVDGAQRLTDAVTDHDVASLIVLTRRFASETREWLAELTRLGGWRGGTATWLTGALLSGPYAASAWRRTDGAIADIGPHVLDLLDAALGPVTEVLSARRSPEDLWQVLLGHQNGATSTATLSLRLPIRPPISELGVFGEHGYRAMPSRQAGAQDCYTALLDDFVAMVHSGVTSHPCDVTRGLHLQRLLDAASRLAGAAR